MILNRYKATKDDISNWPVVPVLLQVLLVHIAPHPGLSRLKRTHDRMVCLMEVLRGMFIFRGVTTTHVTADQAFPQVDPGVAHFQAFFAALATWRDLTDFLRVRAICFRLSHILSP